ncbi:MAG: flagellar export chaperone FliS [Methylococcaceae bacterium]|nr:flagellar export chaperone FliS [Methylococcaceae bacterium]MDZ4158084.1 flagellar export chaperone FliS [Methylococcales bacterium]MDP2392875.1 flagellar export chaperone FliS [Methylococcaceae bacterium]MDP3020403.1 flagellar export chaperone FliS [Methylococcaceae bacterium]MDP3392010.1 flagellar export chaperone FliS [Methylococcaceae bacterium]
MTPLAYRNNANKYAAVHAESVVEDASPHKLIQMLMSGFLMRVNAAKGAINRGDYQEKSIQISKAAAIVGGLIDGVDLEKGGDIAANLMSLYEYVNTRLFEASAQNNTEILDEVQALMREIKQAWDAIPEMYQ